ncbi:MAG: hypothetical protein ACUVXG_01220 [Anaerolineae bacterium]
MRQRLITLAALLAVALAMGWGSAAMAEKPPVSKGVEQRQGNYCIECHAALPQAASLSEWQGDILAQASNPCTTLRRAQEELFYTETLLEAIEAVSQKPAVLEPAMIARRQTYVSFLQTPLYSLDVVAGAAEQSRWQLSQVYARIHDAGDTRTLYWIYGIAVLVTLVLASGVGLAWRITSRRAGRGVSVSIGAFAGIGAVALVAFAIFLWPFRQAEDPNSVMAQGDLVRQSTVDKAEGAAESAERALAKGWVLAEIAADWAKVDRDAAEVALEDGLEAMRAMYEARRSYLADMRAVTAAALNWQQPDEALVQHLQGRIRDAAHRTWGWRAAASAWSRVDRRVANELLTQAVEDSLKEPSAYYRDLDLAGIALVWGGWDADRAEDTVRRIYDPFIRARTWTRLGSEWAATRQGQRAFEKGLEAAQEIGDGYQRFLALMALAEAWQGTSDAMHRVALAAAREAVDSVSSSLVAAQALARWSAAWAPLDATMALSSTLSIDTTLREPRVLGLRGVALALRETDLARAEEVLRQAWDEAGQIERPFDREKARGSVLSAWATVNPAGAEALLGAIQRPTPRVLAQKDVALAWVEANADHALELAVAIEDPYLAVQALTEVGQALATSDPARARSAFEAAAQRVGDLAVSPPLRDLAVAWAAVDQEKAMELAGQVPDAGERAAALRELSVLVGREDWERGRQLFQQALGDSEATWVLGDPFAAAQALRALGVAWAELDPTLAGQAFTRAHQVALAVPSGK